MTIKNVFDDGLLVVGEIEEISSIWKSIVRAAKRGVTDLYPIGMRSFPIFTPGQLYGLFVDERNIVWVKNSDTVLRWLLDEQRKGTC